MEQLKDEETKGKDMLDEKIRLQQALNTNSEDLTECIGFSKKNREETIKLQIKLSQSHTLEEKSGEELNKLLKENDFYAKENKRFEDENVHLQKEIQATIQKIDINSLLKEIDIEDLKILAQSNKQMNSAMHNLIGKWESIQKLEGPQGSF